MKHEIIKTENYLLVVDDSEIKEGDFYLRYNSSILRCIELKESFNEALNKNEIIIIANGCGDPNERSKDYIKKIIAHLPLNNSPILEGVDLLPPLEQEDDVEKLALNIFPRDENWRINSDNSDKRPIWVDGYNKAKEKYRFTEEDMILCWKYASIDKHQGFGDQIGDNYKSFIQSLSQPKMPIGFECSMEQYVVQQSMPENVIGYRCKTTTTPEGHTQWMGKYIYE